MQAHGTEEREFTVYAVQQSKTVGTSVLSQQAFDKKLDEITSKKNNQATTIGRCVSLFVAARTQVSLELGVMVMGKQEKSIIKSFVKEAKERNTKDGLSCKVKISTTMDV
jgi:hypothetical protein